MFDSFFSLRAQYFKCFGEEPQGFETLKRINLIVGRNNSGKSSLLDLVQQCCRPRVEIPQSHWHRGQPARILSQSTVTESEIQLFPENTSGGGIPERSHRAYGRRLVGATITTRLIEHGKHEFIGLQLRAGESRVVPDLAQTNYARPLANTASRNPFSGKSFARLTAERDIAPEGDSSILDIAPAGRGLTNVIQQYLNKSHLPSELVESDLLRALNDVFGPDIQFSQILSQHHAESNSWEIYLAEQHKGRIALSDSGSGLKTIILALAFLHLLPHIRKKPLKDFVFAFEELENNLHPALLRRLLTYIATQAREHDFPVFFTTHSSVAIDLFSKQADAQVHHVTHDGSIGRCRAVQTYIENRGILDDLDVRASDLLQANGIIWVEGPSDRIYLNHWIDLWTDGAIAESNHYQCVFYGGRLLSHLSIAPTTNEGVSVLRVNRNSAILIDSDKKALRSPLNATKKRIVAEIEDMGGLAWVTDGREIENSVPTSVLEKWLGKKVPPIRSPFDNFFDHIDSIEEGRGRKYSQLKPLLAEELCALTTRADILTNQNLCSRLEALVSHVRRWNGLSG